MMEDPGKLRVKDWKKIFAFAVIAAVVFLVDHAAKQLAVDHLADGLRRSYLADTFRLEYVQNTGVILGLGSQLPEATRTWLLPGLTAAVLILMTVMWIREDGYGPAAAGMSLVWAGGFSNLVDRLVYGQVVDFFNFGIGTVRTGTSNLADLAIVAGIPLIMIGWRRSNQPKGEVGI